MEREYGIVFKLEEYRRNLTTSNAPLNHFMGRRFRVGDALLLGGRLNTACRQFGLVTVKPVGDPMHHGSGFNCSIVSGGIIDIGDIVHPE